MNTFEDDNSLPFDIRPGALGFNPAFRQRDAGQEVPVGDAHRLPGHRLQRRQRPQLLLVGRATARITKLAGSHSFKIGADYRILGVEALRTSASRPAATRSTASSPARRQSDARRAATRSPTCCSGYPSSGTLTLNSPFNNFVNYYSVLRAGRLARQRQADAELRRAPRARNAACRSGTTSWSSASIATPSARSTSRSPARSGRRHAGAAGARRPDVTPARTAPTSTTGNPPAIKFSPRVGFAYSMNDKTVVRGGYGLFWAPWAVRRCSNSAGLLADHHAAAGHDDPDHVDRQPVPDRLDRRSRGNALGMLTGRQHARSASSIRTRRAARAPVLGRHAARAARRHERRRRLHRLDRAAT